MSGLNGLELIMLAAYGNLCGESKISIFATVQLLVYCVSIVEINCKSIDWSIKVNGDI